MANYEMFSKDDENLFNEVWKKDKFALLRNYDVNVGVFYKYGKVNKEGYVTSPALTKNGVQIPAKINIVSNFNRMTDEVDVKIILNKEMWDEMKADKRKVVFDSMLSYLEVKEDDEGEPLYISEDSDKVQLKLKKPEFYVEGFYDLIKEYGTDYIPYEEIKRISTIDQIKTKEKVNPKK